eukprot:CAMPEP_0203917848 /NCGR_PEP_ID=MMETSP0359-20131031/58426_1 /ASSEMBLY_ACC=CAM_ASM_000338 /TAXON_ID=268821 /ORGANISM="Scrippsiella Hangoei, Strain SHTV-5" /LENGTH=296 /DNA_ID=CAMNT_0050844827 /DNA_START=86 /DNA_END=972 /DNA_ORIENTATION=+
MAWGEEELDLGAEWGGAGFEATPPAAAAGGTAASLDRAAGAPNGAGGAAHEAQDTEAVRAEASLGSSPSSPGGGQDVPVPNQDFDPDLDSGMGEDLTSIGGSVAGLAGEAKQVGALAGKAFGWAFGGGGGSGAAEEMPPADAAPSQSEAAPARGLFGGMLAAAAPKSLWEQAKAELSGAWNDQEERKANTDDRGAAGAGGALVAVAAAADHDDEHVDDFDAPCDDDDNASAPAPAKKAAAVEAASALAPASPATVPVKDGVAEEGEAKGRGFFGRVAAAAAPTSLWQQAKAELAGA